MTLLTVERDLQDAPPQEVLAWALEHYAGRIALACSFGGPTGIVALDMALEIDRSVPVYYLDTSLLFPETYALVERIVERYGIAPVAVRPEISLAEQRAVHGDELWARDPEQCCSIRKIEPQRAFLNGYDAWISGIRRDQSPYRSAAQPVAWDEAFSLVKISPFAAWDERMIWTYLRAHDLPYNELHDRAYPSIGCTPCTRSIGNGEATRAGRWPLFAKTECGLHV